MFLKGVREGESPSFFPLVFVRRRTTGSIFFFFFTSLLSNCLWGRLLVAASSLSPRQMRPSRKSDETSRPRNKLLPSFRNRAVFSPPPFLASNHGNGSLIVGNNSLRERERKVSPPFFSRFIFFLISIRWKEERSVSIDTIQFSHRKGYLFLFDTFPMRNKLEEAGKADFQYRNCVSYRESRIGSVTRFERDFCVLLS